jgi:hypothetical protein
LRGIRISVSPASTVTAWATIEGEIDNLPGAEQIATLHIAFAGIAVDHHDRRAIVAQRIKRLDRAVEDCLTGRRAPLERSQCRDLYGSDGEAHGDLTSDNRIRASPSLSTVVTSKLGVSKRSIATRRSPTFGKSAPSLV